MFISVPGATRVAAVSTVDLANYDPMDREVQQCPFDHYAALRDHGPVFHHEPTGMYFVARHDVCLLYTSPSPRDRQKSRMPSSA